MLFSSHPAETAHVEGAGGSVKDGMSSWALCPGHRGQGGRKERPDSTKHRMSFRKRRHECQGWGPCARIPGPETPEGVPSHSPGAALERARSEPGHRREAKGREEPELLFPKPGPQLGRRGVGTGREEWGAAPRAQTLVLLRRLQIKQLQAGSPPSPTLGRKS